MIWLLGTVTGYTVPFNSIEEEDMLNFRMFMDVPFGAANDPRTCDTFDKVSRFKLPEALKFIHELEEFDLIT
jgi:hypothetical protein